MSEQAAPESIFSGINIPKVLAGALAAITVAVLGSFLGVAGTLAGAAIASVVGSVGTEIYERSLKRGAKKIQTVVAPTFIKAPAAVGTPEVAAASEEDSPSHTVAESAPRQIRWGRVAAAAISVFVIAMGAVTVFELVAGEPIAAAVGASSDTSGTTFGNVGNKSKSSSSTPATSTSSTPTTQPTTGDESTAPQQQASTPTPQASTPADGGDTGATTAPATGEPTQTTDPGSDADSGTDSGTDGSGGGTGTNGDGAATNPGTAGGDAVQTTQGSGS
jgi:hypothetical protein